MGLRAELALSEEGTCWEAADVGKGKEDKGIILIAFEEKGRRTQITAKNSWIKREDEEVGNVTEIKGQNIALKKDKIITSKKAERISWGKEEEHA